MNEFHEDLLNANEEELQDLKNIFMNKTCFSKCCEVSQDILQGSNVQAQEHRHGETVHCSRLLTIASLYRDCCSKFEELQSKGEIDKCERIPSLFYF